jgi:succinoglycan biosynthesis protein ExoM
MVLQELAEPMDHTDIIRPPDISVCVATFRRPLQLARLLDSLQKLEGRDDFTMEIVVVDNDASQTARTVVESVQKSCLHLYYYVEPRQNISHARNLTVQKANGTWVAFIDDDEVADKNWLVAYWQMLTYKPGDGYFGPVISRLEQAPPSWLDQNIFNRPRHATGRRIPAKETRTTNAFIRRSLFGTYTFDPSFGLIGGGDTELFTRMSDAGAVFYWCDEALTYEYFLSDRVNFRWLMQRAFRGGYTTTRIEKKRHPRFLQQVSGLVKAGGGICIFTLILPFELFRGWEYTIRRLRRICVQFGHLYAIFNFTYEVYKK